MSDSKQPIQSGSEVLMHFTLRLEDGTVAETTENEEPLCFVIGDATLVEGLELALYGLRAGDRQSLQIGPETAYGFADPNNSQPIARAEFPPDMQLHRGMIIEFDSQEGDTFPGIVKEVGEQQVTIDFNHPLASHEITFEVEILEVRGGEPVPLQ